MGIGMRGLLALSLIALAACGDSEPPVVVDPIADAGPPGSEARRAAVEADIADALAAKGRRLEAILAAEGLVEIEWDDLMPAGEEDIIIAQYQDYMMQLTGMVDGFIEEGGEGDEMVQFGTFNTVEQLDGKTIKIPGYVVPFDFQVGEVRQFLLVPYFGACIHAPPPPPNQTIYVAGEEPLILDYLGDAMWIEGVIRAARFDSDLAGAAYTIEMTDSYLFEW